MHGKNVNPLVGGFPQQLSHEDIWPGLGMCFQEHIVDSTFYFTAAMSFRMEANVIPNIVEKQRSFIVELSIYGDFQL